MKKVPKRGRRPEGRSDRAVQDEKLLDALKSFISTGQGTSNEFQFERRQEQKDQGIKPLTSLYGVLCRLLTTIGEPFILAQQGKREGGGALSKNVITIPSSFFFGVLIKNGYFILFPS